MLGKILIINKTDGSVIGWFGEGERPQLSDIELVEIQPNQFNDEFKQMVRMEDLHYDLQNNILSCNPSIVPLTPEQQIIQLQQEILSFQGVI